MGFFLQLILFLHPRKSIVTREKSAAGTSQGLPLIDTFLIKGKLGKHTKGKIS